MTMVRAWNPVLTEAQIDAAGASSLSGFFYAWLSLQRRPDRSLAAKSGDATAEAVADEILSAQTSLMRIAQQMPAKSYEDLAYKLALWRWDATPNREDMDRTEEMAHSVFCDLVEITGIDSLFPPEDAARHQLVLTNRPEPETLAAS